MGIAKTGDDGREEFYSAVEREKRRSRRAKRNGTAMKGSGKQIAGACHHVSLHQQSITQM